MRLICIIKIESMLFYLLAIHVIFILKNPTTIRPCMGCKLKIWVISVIFKPE